MFNLIFLVGIAQKNDQVQPGRIYIKVTGDFASRISQARMSTARISGNPVLLSGIKSLDVVHKRFKVYDLHRVFRDAGVYEDKHRRYGLDRWYELRMDTLSSVDEAIAAFRDIAEIEKVEPAYTKRIIGSERKDFGPIPVTPKNTNRLNYNSPNDPLFSQQWNFNNSGQTDGTPGADIELLAAWKLETGKSNVIVAVMDEGIQFDHPDLAASMWINKDEIPGNNIDDDNNGYVDDVYGYGFGDDTGVIVGMPHGTHVAGIIGGVRNNGVGVSGIAGGSGNGDGVRLMSCAIFGAMNYDHFPESYVYAADMGAVISQNSWTYGYGYESVVLEAINYFIAEAGSDQFGNQVGPMQGGLVVFAAGNDYGYSNPYPAVYNPVIAVAATNHFDKKTEYSNFGSWVDIAAPGGEMHEESQGILSTVSPNRYGFFEGTSMACPHVSGAAALLVSRFGTNGYRPDDLKERLLRNTDIIKAVNQEYGIMLGSGRLNAKKALYIPDSRGPDAIQDISIVEITHTSLKVSWTSPRDSADLPAVGYDLRYSINSITPENFHLATPVSGVPASLQQGATESFTITNLLPGTPYFIAIRSIDFTGNVSNISNVFHQRTYNPPQIDLTSLTLQASLQTGETTPKSLTLYNKGESPLHFALAPSGRNHFALPIPSQGMIEGGDSLIIVITFSADNLLTGGYHEKLILTSNDPINSTTNIDVILAVVNNGAPILVHHPDELNFGITSIDYTGTRKLLVRNAGSEILLLDSAFTSSASFQIDGTYPKTLYPFDTISLEIHFKPKYVENFSGQLSILSNDPSRPITIIALSGKGYDPQGGIVIRPTSLEEALRPNEKTTKELAIRNTTLESVSVTIKAENYGFYNTSIPQRTNEMASAENNTTARISLEEPEETDYYSPKFVSNMAEISTNDNTSAVVTSNKTGSTRSSATHSTILQYATDFESFQTGLVSGEGWYTWEQWTVSTSNPARGQKHLRFVPGNYAAAYSPRVPIGSETKSTLAVRINRDEGASGWWQVVAGSNSTGYVITRIVLESNAISFLVDDGFGYHHLERVPILLPEGYFDIALEVVRATKEFTVYIDHEKVFSAKGFAGNIEQALFLGYGDGYFDVDDLRIIDGDYEGIPYIKVNPVFTNIQAGDSVIVNVDFDAAQLRFGEFASMITVHQQDWEKIAVPTTLTIVGDPLFEAEGEQTILVATGKQTSSQFILRNTGGTPINYAIHTVYSGEHATWVRTDPESYTLPIGRYTYVNVLYDATLLSPGVYTATLEISADTKNISLPITLTVTGPAKILVEPNTLDLNRSNAVTVTNIGESQLNYAIKSNTSFRAFHSNGLTKLNSLPVVQGPRELDAMPNDAAWSETGYYYDPYFFAYFLGPGKLKGNGGWDAQSEYWDVVNSHPYTLYIRGTSDGGGIPSAGFSPRVKQGSENISSLSMTVNFIYSTGTTWQIIPQSLTNHQVATRLQVNPDRSLQVLVQDSTGMESFTRIDVPLPNGYFELRMEVARGSSLFTLFFDGKRVFTGKGFSDQIDQLALVSLNEKSGAAIFINQFNLSGTSSLLMTYDWDIYTDVSEVSGSLEVGESVTRDFYFNESDLMPGVYRDSIKIFSNDPDKPLVLLPYSKLVERPYVYPMDYVYIKPPVPLELSYDTLEATINKGGSATITLVLNNKADVEQSVFFPQHVLEEAEPRYQTFVIGSENFNWKDIRNTGTSVLLGDDDSKSVEMPFNGFITIGSNGYLAFGATQANSPTNKNLERNAWLHEQDETYNVIAPYWDDLVPDELSGIYYQAEGDKFIVQYTDIPFFGTDIRNTFQAIVYSDGAIEFTYLMMNDRQSATIGIYPGSDWHSPYVGIAHNEPFVTDSMTIFLQPPPVFERIDDDWTNPYPYHKFLYPWIHYPEGGSITLAPKSSQKIELKLYSDTDYVPENLQSGVTTGRIFIFPNNFILPVKVTVLENSPPVLGPIEPLTVLEGATARVTFTATDLNDSIVQVSIESMPQFITLHESKNGSATYKIAPTNTDAGEYTIIVRATDLHGAEDTDTLHLSVIKYMVTGFSLVNTFTGEVLFDFTESVTINQADPDFPRFNIRANTIPENVGSLKFKINGQQANIDNTNPYLLKNLILGSLNIGQTRLLAEPFTEASGHGQRGQGKEAIITMIRASNIVVDFSLVNRVTGDVILNFDRTLTLDKSRPDFADLSIRANTLPLAVGSVKFKVDGSQRNIDSSNPYFLKNQVLTSLSLGEHILFAEPFTEANGHGQRGLKREATIVIMETATRVVDFSLVNTVTGEVILNFNKSLNLDNSRPDFSSLNIRANTIPTMVGSVKFKVNGSQINIDNTNPYMLKGQVFSSFGLGDTKLLAEPFTEASGHGKRGQFLETVVTVFNSVSAKAKVDQMEGKQVEIGDEQPMLRLYPNPVRDALFITITNRSSERYLLSITNALGQTVYSVQISEQSENLELNTGTINMNSGVYYIQLTNAKGERHVKKIVKQ
ncbi:MAG: S8 family serine peptidase [Cyclobacteriaceae bacterium]|nr:S8 family serine peptidase [Cyclobacteriaceae bacterium]